MYESGKSQRSNVLHNRSIVVYGGGGGWGKHIVDTAKNFTNNVQIIEKNATPDQRKKAAKDNDVIFLAVPDQEINKILKETKRFLVKNKIVLDCATTKNGFADILTEIANNGASVCSTHPMVMPEVCPRGYNVIIMPIGNNSLSAKNVAELLFMDMGMKIEKFDFNRHDDVMVILQMVPHLIQRILIDAMGKGLQEKKIPIKDVSRLASANYLLAELGVGRIGTQREEVSARIIMSALQTSFGKKIFGEIQSNLGQIIVASENRKKLAKLFTQGVDKLDPNRTWRQEMTERTEVALTRLGNLRSRSCQIDAPNKPGILLDILKILYEEHSIDMTALDSQIIDKDGSPIARFDIGISDCEIDYEKLRVDLDNINCSLIVPNSTNDQEYQDQNIGGATYGMTRATGK
jgi:prephenate dehydrogenase